MEQFGRPCTEAPTHGYPIAENAADAIGIDTTNGKTATLAMSWHRLPARTPRSGAQFWSTWNAVDKSTNDYHYITKLKDNTTCNCWAW